MTVSRLHVLLTVFYDPMSRFYFLKEISKNTKVSGPRTDIDSVTTKNVVIFLEYQLT